MQSSLVMMSVAMVIRTGDFGSEAMIFWVYMAQVIFGLSLALLTGTTIPEIYECAEKAKNY